MHPLRPAPAQLAACVLLALVGCQSVGAAADGDRAQDGSGADAFDAFDEFDEFETAEDGPSGDPLIGYNRAMHGFNDWFFLSVWTPLAKGVRFVLPEPARVSVDRFFKNLLAPPRAVNAALQGRFAKAGTELGRLIVNTTVGVGGLFDPAEAYFGLAAPSSEDFGQTLGHYGVGEGFPLVLPFLGPSSLRDGLAMIPNGFLNPLYYEMTSTQGVVLRAADELNYTSLHIGEYESLKRDALDPYVLLRNAYRQARAAKIEE